MVLYSLWGEQVDIDIPKDAFPTAEEMKKMEANMPGCEHGWIESSTGALLHYRKFVPSGEIKGVVVYMHGITAHSGIAFVLKSGRKISMALLSEGLNKSGYALYALDMLGHGYSEGARWYVPDWKINRNDLDKFCRLAAAEQKGLPFFLGSESYGSTVAFNLAKQWQDEGNAPEGFSGMTLNAPFIVGDLPPAPIVCMLRQLVAPCCPRRTPFFMPNPVTADKLWRDEEVLALHTEPRYKEMMMDGGGRPFRLGTAVSLLNASEAVREAIDKLNVPFCVVHGMKDVPVPIEGTDLLESKTATPKEDRVVYRVEGAYHDLLGDPCAEETMGYLLKFLDERVDKASQSSP